MRKARIIQTVVHLDHFDFVVDKIIVNVVYGINLHVLLLHSLEVVNILIHVIRQFLIVAPAFHFLFNWLFVLVGLIMEGRYADDVRQVFANVNVADGFLSCMHLLFCQHV